MGGTKRKKNKRKEVLFLELEERSMKKIRKLVFLWLLVLVFLHYNFVSLFGDEDIKWNLTLLVLHVGYKIYNLIWIGFHMLSWRVLTNSLNNTCFGTKHSILNLRNMQLKVVLQNGLQQQRNNLHTQIWNW